MKFLYFLLLAVLIGQAALASPEGVVESDSELDSLNKEFEVKEKQNRRRAFFLGRVIDKKLNFILLNDEDILGINALGWPKDDDIGRTARLDMNYNVLAENGRIDVDLASQLFTRLPNPDDELNQEVLEQTHLAITMRLIQSKDKQLYFIVGANYTNQYGKPLVMAYLQKFFHELGIGKERHNIERDINRNFFNAVFGAGKKFDLMNNKQVKLYVIAESGLSLSTEFEKESHAFLTARMGLNIAGWRTTQNPVFYVRSKLHTGIFGEGRIDYEFTTKASVSIRLGKNSEWYIEPGVSATIIRTDEDEDYEGGPSYNLGVHLEFRRRKNYDEENLDYHFLFEDFD